MKSAPTGCRALQALNFFMADMQAGVGPFLGVYLLAHGWRSGWIGSVMTIGAAAGLVVTARAGAWVDASRHKRWLVAASGSCTVLASAMILLSRSFWPVALSQVATAVAGAAIGPAVSGITLGMFRQAGFLRQTAQATMVIAALVAMRMSASRGLWLVLLVSYASLPIRGLIAASALGSWGVLPVQILDGVGAGLQSVAVPALVARFLSDTGRINVGQGAVMTAQGIGASSSPMMGGWLAQWYGYGNAFLILGAFALGSLFIWCRFAGILRAACVPTERLVASTGTTS